MSQRLGWATVPRYWSNTIAGVSTRVFLGDADMSVDELSELMALPVGGANWNKRLASPWPAPSGPAALKRAPVCSLWTRTKMTQAVRQQVSGRLSLHERRRPQPLRVKLFLPCPGTCPVSPRTLNALHTQYLSEPMPLTRMEQRGQWEGLGHRWGRWEGDSGRTQQGRLPSGVPLRAKRMRRPRCSRVLEAPWPEFYVF